MMDSPQEIQILKEYRELEKEIAKRKRTLSSLGKKLSWGDMKKNRPKRYSVDLDFKPPPSAEENNAEERTASLEFLQPSTESFVVDGGTNFYCSTIESSVRFTGNVKLIENAFAIVPVYIEGQPATITLGFGNSNPGSSEGIYRESMFSFNWEIRDTGSDRDWQNTPQPDVFLCSGRLSPLVLPVFGRVKGGSEVEVKVSPFLNSPENGLFFTDINVDPTLSSITGITVQISFHGYEKIL